MSQKKPALNRTAAFARVMEQAHSHMNPAQKAFSKLLHVRYLDTAIEARRHYWHDLLARAFLHNRQIHRLSPFWV